MAGSERGIPSAPPTRGETDSRADDVRDLVVAAIAISLVLLLHLAVFAFMSSH
jgi:hypothetical protein